MKRTRRLHFRQKCRFSAILGTLLLISVTTGCKTAQCGSGFDRVGSRCVLVDAGGEDSAVDAPAEASACQDAASCECEEICDFSDRDCNGIWDDNVATTGPQYSYGDAQSLTVSSLGTSFAVRRFSKSESVLFKADATGAPLGDGLNLGSGVIDILP